MVNECIEFIMVGNGWVMYSVVENLYSTSGGLNPENGKL